MATNLVFLLPCSDHPAARSCGAVLAMRSNAGVITRGYRADDRHRYAPDHPDFAPLAARVEEINAGSECEHAFDEDCALCDGCGTCSEELDADDLCARCV